MAQVQTTISINSNKPDWAANRFAVRSLSLHQPFNGHHTFEVVASVEQGIKMDNEVLASLIGKNVVITIVSTPEKQKEGLLANIEKRVKQKKYTFHGFVDQINTTWTKSSRVLRIKGYSKSILMDAAPVFRTFSEKSVRDIVQKVTKDHKDKIPKLVEKGLGDKVPFMVQCQETDYRFLCRLADEYNRLFFFDGEELYFGDLKNAKGEQIKLKLGESCQHADLSLNLAPLEFKMQGYDLLKDEVVDFDNKSSYSGKNQIVNTAVKASALYPPATIHVNYAIEKKENLAAADRKITARQAHELLVLTGTTNDLDIKIGSRIKFEGKEDLLNEGEYFVIEVSHHISSDDSYQNNFTAVSLDFPFALRMQQGSNLMCGPLTAIVQDHRDPKKLGRIKVKFLGDTEESLSPWLRVLVPSSAKSGFYFLPEKGEKVIVFFEDFNPEKSPFILGSFYHKNADASQWEDNDNRKKGIQLEKIAFVFDDKTGKLTITAEEIELSATQKIQINAQKEMELNGGNSLKHKATRIDLN